MPCPTPGGLLGVTRATHGRGSSAPAHGLSIGTLGLTSSPLPYTNVADITITPLDPLASATDVLRSIRMQFKIEDPNLSLEMGTLKVQYRQQPYPAQSADGWETAYLGADRAEVTGTVVAGFQPGFDGPGSEIDLEDFSGDGERATVEIQAQFGLLPASASSLRVEIWDCDDNVSVLTWSFDVIDDAVSDNRREDVRRLLRAAERYGWDALLAATPTYTFESNEEFTGGQIDIEVNESLLADMGDQLGDSAYGLDILNYTRRYRLLVKLNEYPRDSADTTTAEQMYDGVVGVGIATPVEADRQLPGDQTKVTYTDDERAERVWRYYNVFVLAPPTEEFPDWIWVYADPSTFDSAFAYGRYGHGDKLFELLPDGWKVADGDA